MTASPGALTLSLADVAALAQVQRPVVTTWRSRSRGTEHPFPQPVAWTDGNGQERFDVDDVVSWLLATARGNNPDPEAEAILYAEPAASLAERRRHADTLTALLALSAVRGEGLAGMSRADLLDAADAEDPDDECLYREIAAIDDDTVAAWVSLADRTADAAWNPAAALERLVTDTARPLGAERSRVALTPAGRDLMVSLARELWMSQTDDGVTVFVDRTPGGCDVQTGLLEGADAGVARVLQLADEGDTDDGDTDDGDTVAEAVADAVGGRLTRRRLCAQRYAWTTYRPDARPAVGLYVLQLAGTTDSRAALRRLEHLVLGLTDADRGLILGPASMLVEACPDATDATLRADLFRSGRVRCLVRLPAGLLPGRSREAMAVWVLGPSKARPDCDDQFTLVADLSAANLDDVAIGDLASDVAAAVNGARRDRDQFAARAFRFGRLVPTRTLIATSGPLVTGRTTRAGRASAGAADQALSVDRVLDAVRAPLPGLTGIDVAVPLDASPAAAVTTVAAMIAAGHLRCLPGIRLAVDADADAGTHAGTHAGTRVIGAGTITSGAPDRFVDLLAFTRAHPTARLTEPGDVVFSATGSSGTGPAAVVDVDGGAVVAFPARILRIDAADPGGLNAAVLAADINAQDAGDRRWQQWRVHRVSDADSASLTATMRHVAAAQADARKRLADLQELSTALITGVTAGALTLNTSPATERKH